MAAINLGSLIKPLSLANDDHWELVDKLDTEIFRRLLIDLQTGKISFLCGVDIIL